MSFASELVKWRGKRRQKEVNDLLGVPLKTLQSWEQGVSEPVELAKKQARWIMGADSCGLPVHIYIQFYERVIKQVAAEIQNQK